MLNLTKKDHDGRKGRERSKDRIPQRAKDDSEEQQTIRLSCRGSL